MIAPAALTLSLLAFLSAPQAEAPAASEAREARAPVVVEYGQDAELARALPKLLESWTDVGGLALGAASPSEIAALRARGARVSPLGALAAADELVVLPAEDARAHALRSLWADAEHVVAAVSRAELAELEAPAAGRRAHCGPLRVERRAASPVPPVRWRGLAAPEAATKAAADPRIQVLVDQLDKNNIAATIASLSSNFTRRADQPGAANAQAQLTGWLSALGYTPSTQSFGAQYSKNVVVEIPGALAPQKIVALGAHYDSINSQQGSLSNAPGADDNASGSAALLELARLLKLGGPCENTLRLYWFSGEELGLLGSDYAAAQAQAAGQQILGMLNMDMVAYRKASDTRDCDFATNNTSASLTAFADAVSATYVAGWASKQGVLTAGSSDHASFQSHGFPAVFFFEDLTDFYASIHTASDTQANSCTDYDLAQMIARGVLASALTLAEPVDLAIAHTPLSDTQDGVGPYLVSAQIQSLTAASVSSATLHYSADGLNWTSAPMQAAGANYSALLPSAGSPITLRYYLSAVDSAGGSEVLPAGADLGGEPFAFFVGTQSTLYSNGFEAAGDDGWTHGASAGTDDWQRGTPAGKAGDPGAAFAGAKVWANDLGGSGFNGEYPANSSSWLRSPAINCASASNVHLSFRRWLGVEDALYDKAQIWVNGLKVWENPSSAGGSNHLIDTSWTPIDLDISAQAAGNAATRVEFRLLSDGGLQYGGWNLDELRLASWAPAPPPGPPAFTLAPAQMPAVGGSEITASGTGLGGVLSVALAGQPLSFAQGAGQLRFTPPAQSQLGDLPLVITTAAGSGSANLSVVATEPPALLGAGLVALGNTLELSIGGPPNGYAWLAWSPLLGATSVPGLFELEIGAGNLLAIAQLAAHPLNGAGTWVLAQPVPNSPALAGLVLQLEAIALDLGSASFSTTGALTVVLQ